MFYNCNDIELNRMLDEVGELMTNMLDQIAICENDPGSEFDTHNLKKDIERFIEDNIG